MDEKGYVHVDAIAEFPRLKSYNIQPSFILQCAKTSNHMMVVNDFIRVSDG